MTVVKIGVSTNRICDYTPMAYSLQDAQLLDAPDVGRLNLISTSRSRFLALPLVQSLLHGRSHECASLFTRDTSS